MAKGDTNDMAARLKAVLPAGWFPDNSPVLTAILQGFGAALAQSYTLIQKAKAWVLLHTATDIWLDLHAQDFLGNSLLRRAQESDASFLTRIQAAIFPGAVTRAAVIARLTALTGRVPTIFEPQQPQDTGAYGYGGLGYGVAGGYGSLALPFQSFLTVLRPTTKGIPNLGGYGLPSTPSTTPLAVYTSASEAVMVNGATGPEQLFVTGGPIYYAPFGYGVGLGSYSTLSQAFDVVTDDDIYQAVADIEPAGSIIWTRIKS